jgi:hypothetical protein
MQALVRAPDQNFVSWAKNGLRRSGFLKLEIYALIIFNQAIVHVNHLKYLAAVYHRPHLTVLALQADLTRIVARTGLTSHRGIET